MWRMNSLILVAYFLLVASLSTSSIHANDEDSTKPETVQDECPIPDAAGGNTSSEADSELQLGLNALPVHIAAVTGQLTNVQKCGAWCAEAEPSSACRMDTDIVPCEGDFYCTTTCALWNRFVLKEPTERPQVSCPMFSRFDAYLSLGKAQLCETSCLLPEIRPNRYPAPTGLGLFCTKDTCLAMASALADVLPDIPAKLECPCNWFGSDCPDDWYPIQSIQHTAQYGSNPETAVVATTITVAKEDWHKITANHQPGGVVRLVRRDPDNWNSENPDHTRVLEQPYALAFFEEEEGSLQILTAPPDKSLHLQTRSVAERVRSLPSGPIVGGNLYANPSIAGFFNNQWTFLLPFIEQNPDVQNVVLLSTGAGLSGSISAVQALLDNTQVQIHLYHGIRRSQDLPFQEYLEKASSQIQLTIVESQSPTSGKKDLNGLQSAFERGRAMRKLLVQDSWLAKMGLVAGGKLYVQGVVEQELKDGKYALNNSVFVACGRLALLEQTKEMLMKVYCSDSENAYQCGEEVGRHFFTNI